MSLLRTLDNTALDFYLIYKEPSPRKLTNILTILYNSLSYTLGKNTIDYMTFTIETLIGTALDVWELKSKVTTRDSLQLEHIEISARLTS